MTRTIMACLALATLLCAMPSFSLAQDGSGVSAYSDSASQGVTSTVDKDLQDTMNSAREAYNTAAETTYDEMIPQPEDIQDQAGDCLDGIMNADFGFGLNVPSVSNLLGKACDSINSKVKGHLQEASSQYSSEYMDGLIGSEMGLGVGGDNAPVSQVNYQDAGKQISNDLWQDIEQEKSWLR